MLKRFVILIGLIIAAGAFLRISDLSLPRRISVDEGIYTEQALILRTRGVLAGGRHLAQTWAHSTKMQVLYPPPTRLVYIMAVLVAMQSTQNLDTHAGTYISAAASMITLILIACLGRRLFNDWIAVIGVGFLAFFPPDLLIANRAWTDSLGAMMSALLFCLTVETVTHPRPWTCFAFAASGSLALLVKETCIVVYAPCLLFALWAAWKRRDKRHAAALIAASAAGVLLVFGVWAAVLGNFTIGPRLTLGEMASAGDNPYVLQWQSGPAYLLVLALWKLAPVTLGLTVFGIAVAFLPGSGAKLNHPFYTRALAGFSVGYLLLHAFMPDWLSLRFLSPIYGPLCLFAGMGADHLRNVASRPRSRLVRIVAASGLVVLLAGSWFTGYLRMRQYLRWGLPDLAAPLVVKFDQAGSAVKNAANR